MSNHLKRLLQENKSQKIIQLLVSLPDSSVPPPVELLVYAIHAILSPNPLYSQLSDLIRLLTMVEFWRIRAMSIVSTALVWQTYHKEVASQTIILLKDQEERLFKEHDESNATWREIFIKVLGTCISTHLLRLWLDLDSDHKNSESESHTLFWVYWNEYFKALENPSFPLPRDQENQHQSDSQLLAHLDPVQPFHHRLSVSDIDQLLASLNGFANFIRPSMEPEDHVRYPNSLDEPSPTLANAYIDLINDYLEYVPPLVNEVHILFPDKFPLPW